ncbi:UDP-glucuronosyltransferase 2C1 isoform X3 [Pogona vitticeps]
MSLKPAQVLLLVLVFFMDSASTGNVLVWPVDFSHWLNMKAILHELTAKGHQVTVLLPSSFQAIQFSEPPPFQLEEFHVPMSKEYVETFVEDFVRIWTYEMHELSFWEFFIKLYEIMEKIMNISKMFCDAIFLNRKLLEKLDSTGFDILISDPAVVCGELLAEKLHLPFIYSFRFSFGNTMERLCGGMPSPPSYVPASLGGLTDRMSFMERMRNMLFYFSQDIVFQQVIWKDWNKYYSNILDGCHWINLKSIMDELTARGHQVTVLLPSFFQAANTHETLLFQLEVIPVPFSKADMDSLIQDGIVLFSYEKHEISSWEMFTKLYYLMSELMDRNKIICDLIVSNKKLLKKLESAHFDTLISDPLAPCGELVAEKLHLPFIYSFRFSSGNTIERLCGGIPAPPSYVPASVGGLTDRMTFLQRMGNMLFYLSQDVMFHQVIWKDWNKYYSEVLGRPTTLCETMGKAEMWLIRTYWDFEFPRPFLPNFEFVGGLHCKPAKPLPEEMEKFVQSSGEHGIVVFSLGSMIKNLTDEKSAMVALALSQLPQKVIWRYKGKRPETLGANTRVYDWIPQNDLLGHPKTKAFITHGGTNGVYEAIYHGIPMVGIPMFADQPDNIGHMKAKGMAVELNIHTMTAKDLVDAVNTVIHNATYKENAVRISQIHHDQPVKPLDRAVFWIEFVMRHKGAKHLRVAAHDLTWYQYHSLDVIAFLIVCVALFVFIVVKCCTFCCRKCGSIRKKTKKE